MPQNMPQKQDKQLIGVNVGRLGFAADVEPHEYEQLERLITGDYTTEERILLDVELIKRGRLKALSCSERMPLSQEVSSQKQLICT